MKKIILAVAFQLIAFYSSATMAASYSIKDLYSSGKYYAGANYINSDYDIRDSDQKSRGIDGGTERVGAGFTAHAGFETLVMKNWMVGIEVEFTKYEGKRLTSKSINEPSKTAKAHGVGANIKADYYLNDEFFIGPQVGIQHVTLNTDVSAPNGSTNTFKSSDTMLTYGVQAGYHIRSDLTANVEFRRGKFSDRKSGLETDIESVMIGFEFKI
ncbi:outer membrane beta-barrel protein [Veronia pacifica]|uniref:Outer membrane protein beta-barrel domain-containing protein n=1 Tax=Veronia pacifica TaxID=1080227 RepID=A0A1C3ECA3_9GAMM|nr:outer membrane beta-barrel protein [Veronia pacifica]ODA30830.1 hypothetical protein A8L45_19130 [Veronia pacifica]